jgi:membrane-associated protein
MTDLLYSFVDFVLHIDKHLQQIVTDYQSWTYLILFLIVFCETGLVVTPLLPGDSLLFAAGAVSALGGLDIVLLMALLFVAACAGDNTNYFIGKFVGPKVFSKDYKLLKREYLTRTQNFYEKHGGKTIVIARFMPIIRTFAPFVAGIGTMNYPRFISFSVIGNILWIVSFSLAGYFFGQIPAIKSNFTMVIFGIIGISLLPVVISFFKVRTQGKHKQS